MNNIAGRLDPVLVHVITAFAATAAIMFAIVMPTAYFVSIHTAKHSEIAAEAKLASTMLTQLASDNAELWTYENARIRGLLMMLGTPPEPELRSVFATNGALIASEGADAIPPFMAAASPVYDSGMIVGQVEVRRSLLREIKIAGLIGVLAALLGALGFVALRWLPLRLLKRALARSAHLATHDVLTGLPNRALFHEHLKQTVAWSRREGASLAVLYIDLDRFKEINDTLGHATGDRLLVAVAARLRSCVREIDTLARLGGDEFAIIQVGARQPADTELLAQRLIDAMDEVFELDGNRITVGVSVGIALRSTADLVVTSSEAGILLQEADVALYRAKEEGKGIYRFFAADMNQKLLERRALEADMLEALEKGQFQLHYQPQFDLSNGQIAGAEALLRWRHPLRGDMPPESFIALAEETELIVRIGNWVLLEACRQAAHWPRLHCIAVNVSPVQFRRSGFVEQVQKVLQQTGLDPARLEVEITEGVLLHETEGTLATLARLRSIGVAIAMDDFGTGYSSLGYLRKFRFDKIKIDASFIRALGSDLHAAEIVRAVLRMSHAMGIRVNAEGVEHEHQAKLLREEGCEEVQGFLYSKALSARDFGELLVHDLAERPELLAMATVA
jgi:diguanylate cyclase (GGDEF)-like protein